MTGLTGNFLSRSKQIEKALTGKFYDPYVRFIIWEGASVIVSSPSFGHA